MSALPTMLGGGERGGEAAGHQLLNENASNKKSRRRKSPSKATQLLPPLAGATLEPIGPATLCPPENSNDPQELLSRVALSGGSARSAHLPRGRETLALTLRERRERSP
jgi:hypothetical protein